MEQDALQPEDIHKSETNRFAGYALLEDLGYDPRGKTVADWEKIPVKARDKLIELQLIEGFVQLHLPGVYRGYQEALAINADEPPAKKAAYSTILYGALDDLEKNGIVPEKLLSQLKLKAHTIAKRPTIPVIIEFAKC